MYKMLINMKVSKHPAHCGDSSGTSSFLPCWSVGIILTQGAKEGTSQCHFVQCAFSWKTKGMAFGSRALVNSLCILFWAYFLQLKQMISQAPPRSKVLWVFYDLSTSWSTVRVLNHEIISRILTAFLQRALISLNGGSHYSFCAIH